MCKPLMILVAGPYRSGTNDDAALIHKNVLAMTEAALQLYQMGHMPMLGEWVALPLIEAAGSKNTGDAIFNAIFHQSAIRMIEHCNAVWRIGGASTGADEMVVQAKLKGKMIFYDLAKIPKVEID